MRRTQPAAELRRSILAILAAAGVLPACAGAASPKPTSSGASTGAASVDGVSSVSGSSTASAPPDLRPPPATESKPTSVCWLGPATANGAKALACRNIVGEIPKSSLRACTDAKTCDRGESCFPDEHGQPVCVHLLGQSTDCASNLDCLEGVHCVLPSPDAPRGTCAADSCGEGCSSGTVCAPVSVRDSSDDDDVPTPRGPASPPVFRPQGLQCMPAAAKTYASRSAPSGMCHVSILTSCEVADGEWKCTLSGGLGRHPCGRPLLVDGAAETAASSGRTTGDAMVVRLRAIAFDEHASIVAFSRAIAQLAALGAPIALLGKTSAALADEIEHARLAFELLGSLDGGHPGERPGAFPAALAPLGDPTSLRRALLEDTIRGGAIGESGSVLDALADREGSPPAIQRFLDRIAEDETRHAALAFETIAWLAGDDPALWTLVDRTVKSTPRDALVQAVVEPIIDALRPASAGGSADLRLS